MFSGEAKGMLRGCQKQMIVLQTPESRLFESAFLVLRRDVDEAGQDDMIAEANRIIGNGSYAKKRRRTPQIWIPFSIGAALGVGIFALIYFLCLI